MKFSDNFIFGAATAAYQAEGATNKDNKLKTYWDDYLDRPESKFNAKIASDFYNKFPEDLLMAQKIGVNGIRISLAWSRIMDENNKPNIKGVKYYHNLINECLKNNIEPFVTLHHFDTPLHLFDKGDWLSLETIDKFVEYAKFCFDEFSQVKKWISINEPLSLAMGQYVIGHFPPNQKYNLLNAIRAIHHMSVAHARVTKLFKENNYKGEIGVVHILEGKYPIEKSSQSIHAAKKWDAMNNQMILDELFIGKLQGSTLEYINEILSQYDKTFDDIKIKDYEDVLLEQAGKTDFIGVNYYASHFVKDHYGESLIHHNGTGEKGSSIFRLKNIGELVDNPNIEKTDWDWPIYPEGLYDMLMRISKTFNNPKIYVTENGYGDKDKLENGKINDEKRIDYIKKHLSAILESQKDGADVRGYFLWSLMDVFSWTNGYNKRYGFIYVDFDSQKRYIKNSGYFWKDLSKNKVLEK